MNTSAAKAEQAAINPFIISREFDAPVSLVYQVWSDPQHLIHWTGPKGFTVSIKKMDFKPGGFQHYCMTSEEGHEAYGKAVYREMIKDQKIVYINSFADAEGNIIRHPMAPTWPLEMTTIIAFEDINGKTKLTITWEPINASPEEIKTFNESHASMQGGWGGTFEKLAEYLAELS